jgi:hypothetical protein
MHPPIRHVRLAVVCAALSVLATVLPGVAAGRSAPQWRIWQLSRTTSGPTSIFPLIAAGYDESRVAFAGVFIHRDGRARTVLPGSVLFSDEGKTAPDAYRGGTRVTCAPEACSTSRTRGASFLGLTYQDKGVSANSANMILLAGWGRDVQIDAAEKGWALREVRAPVTAVWATDQADATGVQSRFDSGHGKLPGGGHESCPLADMRTAR